MRSPVCIVGLPGQAHGGSWPYAPIRLVPHLARKSITFDRSTEFVSWPHPQAEMRTQTWFRDPSALWQKGTVENTNRRARRWLSRNRDIKAVSPSWFAPQPLPVYG